LRSLSHPAYTNSGSLEQLEEIDNIRVYDATKAKDDEIIPFDQAVNEIGKKRNDL